jgi:ubiquinone/menaquinone biosynthesis C-methylase UbiE
MPFPRSTSASIPAKTGAISAVQKRGLLGYGLALLATLATVAAMRPVAEPLTAVPPAPTAPAYEFRPGSFDGIGKWFMGREIAHFMSHQGAMWLEREERAEEEQPNDLLQLLSLRPGQVVADVGAGSGYFTWRMAKQVGPTGKVFATDIQPEMLLILRTNLQARGVTNVTPVLGSTTNVNLPANSLDLALFVDVYHECDHPKEIISTLCAALRPGGWIVLVEYRGEEKWVPIKPLHKMTSTQVDLEMSRHPLRRIQHHRLARQHVLIYELTPATEQRSSAGVSVK